MRNSKVNQKMTLLTLVVALGVAVYLNWEYAKSTDLALEATQANAPGRHRCGDRRPGRERRGGG